MRILKNIILAMTISLFGFTIISSGSTSALSPLTVVASASKDAACAGLTEIDNTQDCNNKGAGVTNIVSAAVTIISYIAGIAAVIMVLLAGFKYITSNGDAGKVSSAKNTLIYALVGIAIAVVAQVLVHFAVNTAVDSSTLCSDGVKGHDHLAASDPKCK